MPPETLHRPVTLELTSGERVAGLLVGNAAGSYLLRVDDRSLVIHDDDVVQVIYGGGPATAVDPLASSEDDEASRGPIRRETLPAGDPAARIEAWTATRCVALLDGARAGTKLARWLASGDAPPHACLLEGLSGEAQAVSPQLVELETGPFLDWLAADGRFMDSWGVVVETPCALPALRIFLRGFVRALRQPSGVEMHFRFYDPRVTRPWLDTLERADVAALFGAAWTGVPGGAAEACCPICDEVLPPLRASWCGVCEARLGGDESAPFLLEALQVPTRAGDALIRCVPWPPAPTADGERPPQRRPVRRPRHGARPLVLREGQVAAIEEDFRDRQFEEYYLGRLQRTMPDRLAELGAERAREIIRAGRGRARRYGLVDLDLATVFVDVCFVWHPNFDENERGAHHAILTDPDLPPEQKAEGIWELACGDTAAVRRARGLPVVGDDRVKEPIE